MISLLIPTRGRPDGMRRVVATALATAEEPSDIEAVFYIDNDDLESLRAASDMADEGYPVSWIYGERIVLSQCWNECYQVANGPIYAHMGDDIAFRSREWDTMVTEAIDQFDDKIAFIYGRDGIQDRRLGTHGFLHENWVHALDYFVPPYFSSDYNDTWLNDVAHLIGRRVFLPGVFTEHMHPDVGKGPVDQTHRDRIERHHRDNVDELYRSLAGERTNDAQKLRKVMLGCE